MSTSKMKYLATVLGFILCLSSCNKQEAEISTTSKQTVNSELVARIGDHEITREDLYKGIEAHLYEMELELYETKMRQLQYVMLEYLMQQDSKAQGKSTDEYIKEYVTGEITVEPSDISEFIKKHKLSISQLTDELKIQIGEYIESEKRQAAISTWIDNKTANVGKEIFLKKPSEPRFRVGLGQAPYKGDVNAKVTIVEYSDFQCPYCKQGAAVLDKIYSKYGDKVKIVFKNFPLPFHHNAFNAAQAGLCAKEQSTDKFWLLHDWMFANQTNLALEGLMEGAKIQGLNIEEFQECLASERYAASVKDDIAEAADASVKSTPTFFVNGKVLSGVHPIETFIELIDAELSK